MKKLFPVLVITVSLICQCSKIEKKPNFLWIDASANFEKLSNEDSVITVMQRIKRAGVTDIIVDLKPISGEVLYTSDIAPQALEWRGFTRDADFDYPAVMIREARRRKINVFASMNVFSEGWKNEKRGVIYSRHPEWQTILYTPDGLIPATEYAPGYSVFVNPGNREIQDYELSIIREIMSRYDFDGMIIDRARYDNIRSDFSDEARHQFEAYLGEKIVSWPKDIFIWEQDSTGLWEIQRGELFQKWLSFRACVIRDFFNRVRETIKSVDPSLKFATYVGAWYPSYYEVGVNWASTDYDPSAEYDWAAPDYKTCGYAELLDFLFTGCYFYHLDYDEFKKDYESATDPILKAQLGKLLNPVHTVSGSADVSMRVTKNKIPVYGSLYVQQYKDRENPEQFSKAAQLLRQKTDGVMVFDLVHIENFNWWSTLTSGLKKGS